MMSAVSSPAAGVEAKNRNKKQVKRQDIKYILFVFKDTIYLHCARPLSRLWQSGPAFENFSPDNPEIAVSGYLVTNIFSLSRRRRCLISQISLSD